MEKLDFEWDDIITKHECKDGKSKVEITILDIDAEKREMTILTKQNNILKITTTRVYTDEIGFLYFCYPHSYSDEIYIQESYL